MQLNNKKVNLLVFVSSLFLVACGSDSVSVTEKPDPAETLVEDDFNNQTFVVKGNLQVANSFTFFNKSKTGIEFTGNSEFGSLAEKKLTWRIDDKNLKVILYDNKKATGEYSFSREKLDNNIYEGRKGDKKSYLYKALPFTLNDLNKKVIKFIKPSGCAGKSDVRTLKVEGNKAILRQICAGVKAYPVTFNVKVKSDMVNTLEFIEQGVGKHILMSLIKGDVKKLGSGSDPKLPTEVSMVYLNEKNLTTERIEIVNKEAPSK